MLFCNDPKVLLWLPPKTGTTSLISLIEQKSRAYSVFSRNRLMFTPKIKAAFRAKKHWYPTIQSEIDLLKEKYKDHKCIITVRNPFQRAVSFYVFRKNNPHRSVPLNRLARECSFEQWLMHPKNHVTQSFRRGKLTKKRFASFAPQACWLWSMWRTDGIIRIESFDQDVSNILNIKLSMPAKNASSYKKHWKEYYTPAAESFVRKHFKDDFELLGYETLLEKY